MIEFGSWLEERISSAKFEVLKLSRSSAEAFEIYGTMDYGTRRILCLELDPCSSLHRILQEQQQISKALRQVFLRGAVHP